MKAVKQKLADFLAAASPVHVGLLVELLDALAEAEKERLVAAPAEAVQGIQGRVQGLRTVKRMVLRKGPGVGDDASYF